MSEHTPGPLLEEQRTLEAALEIVCAELGDHACPHSHGMATWDECGGCPHNRPNDKDYFPRYDGARDRDCWRRWAIEEAHKRLAADAKEGKP